VQDQFHFEFLAKKFFCSGRDFEVQYFNAQTAPRGAKDYLWVTLVSSAYSALNSYFNAETAEYTQRAAKKAFKLKHHKTLPPPFGRLRFLHIARGSKHSWFQLGIPIVTLGGFMGDRYPKKNAEKHRPPPTGPQLLRTRFRGIGNVHFNELNRSGAHTTSFRASRC
jgi:hypothetical protein